VKENVGALYEKKSLFGRERIHSHRSACRTFRDRKPATSKKKWKNCENFRTHGKDFRKGSSCSNVHPKADEGTPTRTPRGNGGGRKELFLRGKEGRSSPGWRSQPPEESLIRGKVKNRKF